MLLPPTNPKPYAATHPFLYFVIQCGCWYMKWPDVSLCKASYAGSQFDNQWIMHSFNSIILWRSFTGRFWRYFGGRVTDGPSARTFLRSQSASNGEDIQLRGLTGWWQSCCCKNVYRQKADGLAAKSMSVCLSCQDWKLQPDNSSGFSLAVLRSCHGNWWTTDEAFALRKATGLSVNTQYVLPVAMLNWKRM